MKLIILPFFLCTFLLVHTTNACVNGRAGIILMSFHSLQIEKYRVLIVSAHFVQDTIDNNKVVIFSKSTCLYSNLAKEQFQKLKFPFHVVELDNRHDGDIIQGILGEITDATTVPRVFVDGKFIGGGTEVKKLYESGDLKKLLKI